MDSPSPPTPDPSVGQAQIADSQVAADTLAFNKEQWAANQTRQAGIDAQTSTIVGDLMKGYDAQQQRQASQDQMTQQAQQLQLGVAQTNQAHADQAYQQYQDLFVPVQQQMVSDANQAGSSAMQEQKAGEATQAFNTQLSAQNLAQQQQQQRMGVNPSSPAAMALADSQAITGAAQAGATGNQARQAEYQRGIAERAGVANFSVGLGNSAANTSSVASGSAGAGVSSGATNMGTANMALSPLAQSANPMLSASQNSLAGQGMMNQGFGTTSNAYAGVGQLGMMNFNQQLGSYQAQTSANNGLLGGLGSMAGIAAGLYMSTESSKDENGDVDPEQALQGLRNLPVKDWTYKPGMGDGSRHVGPYAEAVNDEFGDQTAPGGKAIDGISMQGLHTAAIQALADRQDRLEKSMSSSRGARGGRAMVEPASSGAAMSYSKYA